jgi:hypothetical protein
MTHLHQPRGARVWFWRMYLPYVFNWWLFCWLDRVMFQSFNSKNVPCITHCDRCSHHINWTLEWGTLHTWRCHICCMSSSSDDKEEQSNKLRSLPSVICMGWMPPLQITIASVAGPSLQKLPSHHCCCKCHSNAIAIPLWVQCHQDPSRQGLIHLLDVLHWFWHHWECQTIASTSFHCTQPLQQELSLRALSRNAGRLN